MERNNLKEEFISEDEFDSVFFVERIWLFLSVEILKEILFRSSLNILQNISDVGKRYLFNSARKIPREDGSKVIIHGK